MKQLKEKTRESSVPLKASCMPLTSDWPQAQTHEAVVPPSCESRGEFPTKKNMKSLIKKPHKERVQLKSCS